jgi:hypothetical protein
MQGVPGWREKDSAAYFCSHLDGERVQAADGIIQNHGAVERHLGDQWLDGASQSAGGPMVALDDDGAHSRIPGLARGAQAVETAGYPKISRGRHIRPEMHMHIDGPVHDLVNYRAKIFLCEHGSPSF